MCLTVIPVSAMATEPFRPPPAKEGYSYPECYCTNRGKRVEVGSYTCLRIGDRQIWAFCDMSLNNPVLRHVQEGCPTAWLPGLTAPSKSLIR
ncbi:hypothetical protein A3843_13480 [Pseudovibrio exalbescens]|uniref:Uncharacterized protein n=2 Tax=Pseudovibrio exalbescens TaxID=197461 RepID=A0A1U7JG05_9HYPH|nr:hypothetical protein A3843_13480 [Pseudovibrio exalbescens]